MQNIIVDSSSSIWIKVEISEGMFSTEMAVSIKLANGKNISLFADKELLKKENGEWLLKVDTVKKNHDNQLVLLPIEPFENPTRWVEVPL